MYTHNDCHNSDEMNDLLNSFRLNLKKVVLIHVYSAD